MNHTFKCPHCTAPMGYDDAGATADAVVLKCGHCGISSAVPENLRPKQPNTPRVLSSQVVYQINSLIATNRKVEAIKLLRDTTRLGLKESKDAIDAFENGDVDVLNTLLKLGEPVVTEQTIVVKPQAIFNAAHQTARPKSGSTAGCIFTFIGIAAVVIGVGYAVWQRALNVPANILPDDLPSVLATANPVVLKPAPFAGITFAENAKLMNADEQSPDVIGLAFNTQNNSSQNQLVAVDTTNNRVRWQHDADTLSQFLATNNAVYLANGTRLVALSRNAGTVRWETTLSDKASASCDDCLALAGELVIALTNDNVLQAFDVDTGKKRWSKELANVTPRFWVWGEKVIVVDRNKDADGLPAQVRVLNNTGDAEAQFDLTCKTPRTKNSTGGTAHAQPYSALHLDKDSGMLFAWYGTFSSCAQKWDLATGKNIWSVGLDADPPENDAPAFVQTRDALFVGGAKQVFALNVETGKAKALIESAEDYDDVRPMFVQDGVLVARAKRTRGSSRLELWGLDANTGKRLWDVKFGEGGSMDKPDRMMGIFKVGDEATAWTAHMDSNGQLQVLRFTAKPALQLSVESINPNDGTSKGQQTIPIKSKSLLLSVPSVVGWQGNTAWLQLDHKYYAVDTQAAKVVYVTE